MVSNCLPARNKRKSIGMPSVTFINPDAYGFVIEEIAARLRSFNCWWQVDLPALCLQERPCRPRQSTVATQWSSPYNHMTYNLLHSSEPQYLKKLINIKLAVSTRSSDHLTLLRPSTSSLKVSNLSYNQIAPILWNNLPKSLRTFSNALHNLQRLVNVPRYRSHFLSPNFAPISKHTFSTYHTHRTSILLGLTKSISTLKAM